MVSGGGGGTSSEPPTTNGDRPSHARFLMYFSDIFGILTRLAGLVGEVAVEH